MLCAATLPPARLALRQFRDAAPFGAYIAPLLALNLALSANPHASMMVMSHLSLVAVLVLGLTAVVETAGELRVAVIAAAAGTASACVALWQGLIGFSLMAETLATSASPIREKALARLGSGRVFGTLLLPASLGGALAISIPLSVALFLRLRTARSRSVAGATILIQGFALAWTFSLGAWISLAVAAFLIVGGRAAVTLRGRRTLAAGACAAVLLLAAGYGVRRFLLPQPGLRDAPVAYRAGNWLVAARMIGDHPLLGTGLGTFGSVFPLYRREGVNESRYAHNTWLQLMAEMGIGVVPLLVAVILGAWHLVKGAWRSGAVGAAGTIGVVAFVLQNGVDFTFYQASVGALFAAALALGLAGARGGARQGEAPLPEALAGEADATAALVWTMTGVQGHAQAQAKSRSQTQAQHEAKGQARVAAQPQAESRPPAQTAGTSDRSAVDLNDGWSDGNGIGAGLRMRLPMVLLAAACATVLIAAGLAGLAIEAAAAAHGSDPRAELRAVTRAVRCDPFDPDLRSSLARVLAASSSDEAVLGRARSEAVRAVGLDPRTPYRWWDLAQIELRRGRPALAWIEMGNAASLYPMEPRYGRERAALEERLFPSQARGPGK